ncbi:MAG: hypothetical protein QM647_13990 [Asticcacaulis sp.]|uniref:hypothetical protein n=1 Tax=Asticcacaulis sp. TaxID=1872648 RepID=UPI0039E4F179
MRAASAFCTLALVCGLAISSLAAAPVHAEGSPAAEDETDAPKPKPVVKRKKKPAAKPAPVVTTPAAPVPYSAYSSGNLSPDMSKALTPGVTAPTPLPPPVAIAPAPITMQPIADPPPAPPVAQAQPAKVAPAAPVIDQISLKCETQVTEGKRFISQGVFYIDLFPSPVFPDENADFKFLFVDPGHSSLIRESICLDTLCPANVTGAAYYLVNRVTRRGSALRITLDRSNGAFYAEEIDNKRIRKDAHLGEKGFCTPQKLPNALF